MAVKIAPTARQQFEDANGNPYVGGKLFTYAAGSSTKQATYTDSTGLSANTNPIILDSAGRTPYGVWLTAGLNYKFVLAPSTDTDPPSSPIFTEDVVSGVNDTTTTTSQWIASGATPTYINATQFTLVGDKTADFHVGRRLKFTVTAGTVYGRITATAYTTLTTVTVLLDSGALDTGLSAVELSILTSTGSALPGKLAAIANLDGSVGLVKQTGAETFTKIPEGKVLQVVHTDESSLASGATIMPFDDTIPQNTEGEQFLSAIITPKSATSKLRIDVSMFLAHSAATWITAALFVGTTADAIAAASEYQDSAWTGGMISFSAAVSSASTAARTYTVRAGGNGAGTINMNGTSDLRRLAGVMASSIRITEIEA